MPEKIDIRAFREMHDDSVQCAYINESGHSVLSSFIDVRYNGDNVSALCDSGATISIVRSDMLPEQCRLVQEKFSEVSSFAGHRVKILGTSRITLGIGENEYAFQFYVCDSVQSPFIIGSDFIKYHGATIDYCTNTLTLNASRPVPLRPQYQYAGPIRACVQENLLLPPNSSNLVKLQLEHVDPETGTADTGILSRMLNAS